MKLRATRLKKKFLNSPQLIRETVWVELELLPSSSVVKQNWLLVSSSVAYVFFWPLRFNKREGRFVLLYLSSPGFIYTLKILRRTAYLSHSIFCILGLGILICRFFFPRTTDDMPTKKRMVFSSTAMGLKPKIQSSATVFELHSTDDLDYKQFQDMLREKKWQWMTLQEHLLFLVILSSLLCTHCKPNSA